MPLKTKKLRREWQRNWRKQNPEKVMVQNEKSRLYQASKKFGKYGITEDDYNDMFVAQNGKCGVCGKHQSELKTAFHIDHDHKTDTVRGLLCPACNLALGHFQDDIENLKCAILYLNKRN